MRRIVAAVSLFSQFSPVLPGVRLNRRGGSAEPGPVLSGEKLWIIGNQDSVVSDPSVDTERPEVQLKQRKSDL